MKNLIILSISIVLFLSNCNTNSPDKTNSKTGSQKQDANGTNTAGEVIAMTNDMFKKEIFDYEANKHWDYEGDMPVIIDFYATWCKPCKKLSTTVEEIAKQYAGKIIVYKVDTDAESTLAQGMGIKNLPTLFFIPVKGQPRSAVGLMPKEELLRAINQVLLVN